MNKVQVRKAKEKDLKDLLSIAHDFLSPRHINIKNKGKFISAEITGQSSKAAGGKKEGDAISPGTPLISPN